MSKLKLSDREVSLIKVLIRHKRVNDQEALSVFSYLHRNINHREISAIRQGTKARYAAIPAASATEVDQLLYDYAKIEGAAAKLGFCELDDNDAQAHKAVEIMKTAISAFNSGTMISRSETFIVLAVIAWTYAIHSFLRRKGTEPVYLDDAGNVVVADGQPKLWDLARCLREEASLQLSPGTTRNLKYVLAIRHAVEHRSPEDINDDVQAKIQANALNFLAFVRDRFGPAFDFSRDLAFAIQLQALTLKSPNAIKGPGKVSKSVEAVNAALESGLSEAEYNDPDYSFRVYVVPKVTNNSKKADQAVIYSPIGSGVEVAIKQVERPKHRMKDALTMLGNRGIAATPYTFMRAWKDNNLKDPAKAFAVQLGGQWFWYPEGVDKIAELLAAAAHG
jgi:ribosomal protein L22